MNAPPRVLVIGVDPLTLNPADWGVTAEDNVRMRAAIAASEASLRDAGYAVELCLIPLDADIETLVGQRLRAEAWDCVLIGGGIRKPESLLELFERVVNLVHREAPQAAIAFNSRVEDVLAAVQRWVRLR